MSRCSPQLRTAVRDVAEVAEKDDHYFLRWLRARKFDVSRAEDMLRKVSSRHPLPLNSYRHEYPVLKFMQHIETRKKYKLDTILTDFKPPEVRPG